MYFFFFICFFGGGGGGGAGWSGLVSTTENEISNVHTVKKFPRSPDCLKKIIYTLWILPCSVCNVQGVVYSICVNLTCLSWELFTDSNEMIKCYIWQKKRHQMVVDKSLIDIHWFLSWKVTFYFFGRKLQGGEKKSLDHGQEPLMRTGNHDLVLQWWGMSLL